MYALMPGQAQRQVACICKPDWIINHHAVPSIRNSEHLDLMSLQFL